VWSPTAREAAVPSSGVELSVTRPIFGLGAAEELLREWLLRSRRAPAEGWNFPELDSSRKRTFERDSTVLGTTVFGGFIGADDSTTDADIFEGGGENRTKKSAQRSTEKCNQKISCKLSTRT
jgi:hypothetical protein